MERNDLEREIGQLEARLDPASNRTIDELATIRRRLGDGDRSPGFKLPKIRLGFACTQRWDDMVGDDRVRACGGCDRPVFNLSAMTREDAERLLATRGVTPCVRFYRRPDGTVMTSDCPTGSRREGRRLAVVASSLAAGTALAAPSSARADAPETAVATPDSTDDATAPDSASDTPATDPGKIVDDVKPIVVQPLMGIPDTYTAEMGAMVYEPEERPAIEWSLWGRLGFGVATQHPSVLARRSTPSDPESASRFEAAIAAELTVGIANEGNLRLGTWGELRTSSDPVAGLELVVEGLPPHPHSSHINDINGAGTVVLRAGGNAHVLTTALGVGYVGSRPRWRDPWIKWANHVVGGRVVASMDRSLDDPRDWSVSIGLEVEPIGALHAVLDL